MEMKEIINKDLTQNNKMEHILPKLSDLNYPFLSADMLEFLKTPSMELLNEVERSWKKIENFEFQKMDVKASFEQLIKRI